MKKGKENILHYKSVEHFFQLLNQEKPLVNGFGILNLKNLQVPKRLLNQKVTCEFYSIMVNNVKDALSYGSSNYDLSNGLLTFVAPNQVIAGGEKSNSHQGWIICFSPAFLKKNKLLQSIDHYNLFSYNINTALSLDKEEQQIVENVIERIMQELKRNDCLSREIIGVELELLLKHSKRALLKQYKNVKENNDILSKIEKHLNNYFTSQLQMQYGLPKIAYLSENLNLSERYLSKIINQITGIKTTDYINQFVINKSKVLLLSSSKTVQEIAYDLGFSQPHYFTKLFKKYNQNITPLKYRGKS